MSNYYTLHFHGHLITNPLSLPLYITPNDNEVCSIQLYLLTTALNPKQFTQIGDRQSLTKFTSPEANDYSINYYDHNIIRPNEDICLNNDLLANPQITKKFSSRPHTPSPSTSEIKNTTMSSPQHYVVFMLMVHTLTKLTIFH